MNDEFSGGENGANARLKELGFAIVSDTSAETIDATGETRLWLVRGGERGQAEAINLENSVVSIGWSDLPDLSSIASLEEMRQLYRERYPDATAANLSTQAGQVYRFARELREGDLVLMPLRTKPGFVAIGRVYPGQQACQRSYTA